MFEGTCLCVCVSLLTTTNGLFSRNCKKTMFLSQKFANTRSTKALRDSAAVPESQPTPATLLKSKCDATPIPAQQDFPVLNCLNSPCEKMAFADESNIKHS